MLKFYHCPHTRASTVRWLLEELGVPYETELVDINAEGGVPEAYRAVQPHKKVPAIVHDGVTITERAAICIYLADAFPEAGLAPRIGEKARGPYLTWLAYADAVFDPALCAKIRGLDYVPRDFSFGSYEDMITNLERRLSQVPFIAGEVFSAADTQIAGGIGWAMYAYDAFPRSSVFTDYLARCQARPAHERARQKETA
jgi:glutathione S-transferase